MNETGNLRERKKAESRLKIMKAAAWSFKNCGFSETSIADIMKEAGLGVGTFYNYFNSKEDLLLALLKTLADKVEAEVEAGREQNLPALELLNHACNVMAELLDDNRYVLPLFLSASEHCDRPEMIPTRNSPPTFKPIFEEIITHGQEAGEIRKDVPADLIAEMFHSLYQAASFSRLNIPFRENIRLKTQLIIDGIRTQLWRLK